jgi:hypothetical protein
VDNTGELPACVCFTGAMAMFTDPAGNWVWIAPAGPRRHAMRVIRTKAATG